MIIPQQLIEVLDIALSGYRKENENFVISVFNREEELLQVINKNMAEESESDDGSFGLALSICFDKSEEAEIIHRYEHSYFGHESIKTEEEDLVYFTKVLEDTSEKAAKTIAKLLKKIYLLDSFNNLAFQIYEVE
jgi:hypothetical protein